MEATRVVAADEQLRAELREMFRVDQDLRKRAMDGRDDRDLWAQVGEADERNTARMKQIIEEHGWPGRTLVGEDGANAAWLLVQHADADPTFQEQCLDLMAAAGGDEVRPMDLAYLTDRVRVNTGRPQVYGTQFWTDEAGRFGPRPVEDEARVDERRASVGLGTLDEYRRMMDEINGQGRDEDAGHGDAGAEEG